MGGGRPALSLVSSHSGRQIYEKEIGATSRGGGQAVSLGAAWHLSRWDNLGRPCSPGSELHHTFGGEVGSGEVGKLDATEVVTRLWQLRTLHVVCFPTCPLAHFPTYRRPKRANASPNRWEELARIVLNGDGEGKESLTTCPEQEPRQPPRGPGVYEDAVMALRDKIGRQNPPAVNKVTHLKAIPLPRLHRVP